MSSNVVSVSSLVQYLKRTIDGDMRLKSLMVSGEISNFTNHRSGHLYFSLKDSKSKMNCVMFRTHASSLNLELHEGMKVIITCNVSLYEPQGSVQLYVTKIQSDGIGDLYLAYEKLKKKLLEEGLFEEAHKKALPEYPFNIAVISAKTGAAIQDVTSIIQRRWPICKVTLYPSLVQGEAASPAIIKNLMLADAQHHDLILLVRGGGSIEDLWCFNNEELARVIYNLDTCIVSGVGHETDTTLVDYVSDARAATPSAAAELVTPNIEDVTYKVNQMKQRLESVVNAKLLASKNDLRAYQENPIFTNSENLFADVKLRLMMNINRLSRNEVYFQKQQYELNKLKDRLQTGSVSYLNNHQKVLGNFIALLDAYSPLEVLKRGYSIASKDDKIIRSIEEVSIDDKIKIRLNDGIIDAKVIAGEQSI